MNEVRKESPEDRERRLRNYYDFLKMLEIGEKMDFPQIPNADVAKN